MNAPSDTVDDHALPVPPKRSSVRAPRRQGLVLRMEQRLLCGLVENLAPPNHSATTVEHGNRTKARAICDHVYSCQGDWLNEPTLRLLDFYHLINDDARLLCWLARRRLISNQMRCNKSGCDSPLFLTPDRANMDGWSWHCGHCRRRRSIRHQSIFAHSNLPIKIATQILFLWSVGHPEELIAFDAGTSTQDADDWLHCIREVCRETNTSIRERIGGIEVEGNGNEPGYCRVVEVDESMFSCWLRDPKSGPILRKIWLLGGVERGTERVFLTRCPKNARDASSLIPIIRDFVKVRYIFLMLFVYTDFFSLRQQSSQMNGRVMLPLDDSPKATNTT
ncbi:unnamed protein product [Dicrocoelium dendriticum]|nr:unnamed protein product [Dicrocoelium dendriticum]